MVNLFYSKSCTAHISHSSAQNHFPSLTKTANSAPNGQSVFLCTNTKVLAHRAGQVLAASRAMQELVTFL